MLLSLSVYYVAGSEASFVSEDCEHVSRTKRITQQRLGYIEKGERWG